MSDRPAIPRHGTDADALLATMTAFGEQDVDFAGGHTWSLVYWAGEAHHHLVERAFNAYMATNALNPLAFQSLKRMEREVVQMSASLMNGPASAVGTMTSGGTESLLLAVKTYRDRARKRRPFTGGPRRPNMVVPETIHVAFEKAAHYFGVRKRVVPVLEDGRVDVAAMRRAIDHNTIFLAASAPQYPTGAIDPIAEIGALALEEGLPFHVDACFGGFILPWLERLGVPVAPWDFRVPGVTSISADLHKYGYAPKGASVIVYRDMSYLRHQFFAVTGWSGGIYISPSLQGTRAGGAIAAAWASLNGLGEEGFLRLAKDAWEVAERLRAGIRAIPGLRLLGRPDATIVTWAAAEEDGVDVYAVGDQLQAMGWSVDRQQRPPSVHCSAGAANLPVVDDYLRDLRAAVETVRANPALATQGEAAIYGLMAKVPIARLVKSEVLKVLEGMYGAGDGDVDLAAQEAPGGERVAQLVNRFGPPVQEALDRLRRVRARLRVRLPRLF